VDSVRDPRGLVVPAQRTIDYAYYPRVPQISLELTNHCNLKCPYCANPALTRPKGYIDWSLLEKITDECAERKYELNWIHGVGEPLLWDRLEEVVALIKRKRAGRGSFATNGTLLRPERVRSLLDAGLDSIYVSIDTLDPVVYKNTRGGKLDIVIRHIQEMIDIVPKTFLITVALMNHKDNRVTEETIEKFHQVFGRHPNVRTNLVQNMLFPSAPGDYRLATEKLSGCFSPANYVFIAVDGRVAICCMDQDVQHSLGSVAERTIHDIWFDPKNQTTFRNVAQGIFDCPDVCTKSCVLSAPKADVDVLLLGHGTPFEEASRFGEVLLQNEAKKNALAILQAVVLRDPSNRVRLKVLHDLEADVIEPPDASKNAP